MTTELQGTFRARLISEIADPFTEDEVLNSADLTEVVLDSLGIVEVLELIEDVYGVHIDEDSVHRNDFKTVAAIEALIISRL